MRPRTWCGCRSVAFGWLVTGWIGVLVGAWPGLWSSATVWAQDAPAKPAAEVPAEELADAPEPAAAAPVAPGGAKLAAAADQSPRRVVDESYLSIAFQALGWSYTLIFLGISFTLVALLVMNLLMARRENVCPGELVERFEKHLDEKQYQEAYELAKGDESFLGQVLAAGLAKLSAGFPQAIEAMQEVGEEENMKLDHRLSYMALIGTISPMVGLFGTVQGMIASFRVIANSTGTPPPSQLAQGIYTALYTTLVGLFIAIPAIAAYNILKNRVDRLVLEVGIVSEGLMDRFENIGPRKK